MSTGLQARTLLAVLAVGMVAPGLARAGFINLVQNGSFEQTSFPVADNSFQVFFGQGQHPTFFVSSWRSVFPTQNIEIQRKHLLGITAFDGDQWLEMDDASNVVDMNHLFQDLSTEAGQVYELSLRYRGRPGAPLGANVLGVRWNGTDLATLTDPNPTVTSPWFSFTALVTATGPATRLQLEDRGPADPGFGMLVDDVRVVAVPEPSSFLLLLAGASVVCLGRTTPGRHKALLSIGLASPSDKD